LSDRKAAINGAHSKRFAKLGTLGAARQRLECARFIAAFPGQQRNYGGRVTAPFSGCAEIEIRPVLACLATPGKSL